MCCVYVNAVNKFNLLSDMKGNENWKAINIIGGLFYAHREFPSYIIKCYV